MQATRLTIQCASGGSGYYPKDEEESGEVVLAKDEEEREYLFQFYVGIQGYMDRRGFWCGQAMTKIRLGSMVIFFLYTSQGGGYFLYTIRSKTKGRREKKLQWHA
jgi:hypothetical protein